MNDDRMYSVTTEITIRVYADDDDTAAINAEEVIREAFDGDCELSGFYEVEEVDN